VRSAPAVFSSTAGLTTIASGNDHGPRDRSVSCAPGRRQCVEDAGSRQERGVRVVKRVSVGLAFAAAAAAIVDPAPGRFSTTNLLPEQLAQRSGENSRQGIRAAAGRVSDQPSDRLVRKVLSWAPHASNNRVQAAVSASMSWSPPFVEPEMPRTPDLIKSSGYSSQGYSVRPDIRVLHHAAHFT